MIGQTIEEKQIRFYKVFGENNSILIDKKFIYLSKNDQNIAKKLVDFIDEKSLSSIINANISLQNDQIFILVSNVLKVINIIDWSLQRIPLPTYNLSYNRIKVLNV